MSPSAGFPAQPRAARMFGAGFVLRSMAEMICINFNFNHFWKTKPNVTALPPPQTVLSVSIFVRVTSALCAWGPCGLFFFVFVLF